MWRSHTTDPTRNAPDLSVSRVRRAIQVHQRAQMVSPRLATQEHQSMTGAIRSAMEMRHPVTPEVFPLSDDADVALLPSREVVASRRVVLVPHSPGTPRSDQLGRLGAGLPCWSRTMRKRKWSLIQRLTSQTRRASVSRPTRRGGHGSAH